MTTVDFEPILRGKTPNRCFLNNSVERIDVDFPLLDVAGKWESSYHDKLPTGPDNTEILNLPREPEKTVAADAESTFPFKNDSFETVFCFNALEHLYEYETTVSEMARVLAPGGRCYVYVPFLHRIHGDPHDHQRLTPSRLRRYLRAAGFTHIALETLDPGPLSAAVVVSHPVFKLAALKYLVWEAARRIDPIVHRMNDALKRRQPLGIFVEAMLPAGSARSDPD